MTFPRFNFQLRGLFAGAAVVAQVYSLQYLSIGDSTVICFSTPVFITFLAHFILGEPLGIVPVATSVFTLGGVIVIMRPPVLTGGELSVENLVSYYCVQARSIRIHDLF